MDPVTAVTTISTVAPAVEQSIIARIKPHFKRAFYSKSNLASLKNHVESLKNAQTTVESLVNEAKNNLGREIHPHVEAWLKKVEAWTRADKFTQEDGNAQKKCFIGLCPNYITRYQLSLQAEVGAKDVDELLKEAAGYDATDMISCRPAALASRLMSIRDIEPFHSRTLLLEKVIEALKDSDVNMIGVHGMGGVGKTTLMKSVAAQVLREELFNNVVISTVTAKPDLAKIQEEIAETLGLRLEEKSEKVRAIRLSDRLKQEKNILVIFDDLWKRLDLQSVGIPHPDQQNGLKILMTSRNENVLSREMEAKMTFQLQVLSEDEARNLFEKTVGNVEKDSELGDDATKVAKRCAGLPVLLVAVGRALRNASLHAWKDALEHLAKFEDSELDAQIASALGLSYKLLKEEESKSLFLLCGQLGSSSIFIRDLLAFTAGLGLIRGRNLREVRNRLYKLLDDLKASSLLLEDDDDEEFVKMHDVVRNFAISVAYKDHGIFTVTDDVVLREWPAKDKLEQFTAISVPFCEIPELPEVFDGPNLESLLLLQKGSPSMKIPDNLFKNTKKIKLIDLRRVNLSPIPSSLEFLENLQSLILAYCVVEDITPIGKLEKLQVLSLAGSSLVRLPDEIRQLTRLQFLSLSYCQRLEVIPPNVLLFLIRLEEFFMTGITLEWHVEEFNMERKNASLVELKPLLDLSSLDIHITDVKMLPEDLTFRKLERFSIFIGDGWDWNRKNESSRTLKLKLNTSTHLGEGLKELLKKSETLYLQGPEGVKDVLRELDQQGLSQLKHLNIRNSLEIQHITSSVKMGQSHNVFPSLKSLFLDNLNNLEKICHEQLTNGSFSNLSILKVGNCDRLKYLISFSVARGLLQLEKIEITGCKIMEEIAGHESDVAGGAGVDEQIQWTQLRSLVLQNLPLLKSFCSQVKVPLMSKTSQRVLATDAMSSEIIHEGEHEQETPAPPPYRNACLLYFLSSCINVKASSKSFTRQKSLGSNGRSKKNECEDEPIPLSNRKIVFPNLEELRLSSLNMERLWDSRLVELNHCSQKLTSLTVEGCDKLSSLLTYSMVKSLRKLRKLEISACQLLEAVIVTDEALGGGETEAEVLLPHLDFLKIKGLPQLVRFCNSNLLRFPSLKRLCVEDCPKLKNFISVSAESANMRANTESEIAESSLFDEKVALPKLEELIIVNMVGLKQIWHDQLHEDSFGRLKALNVRNAAALQNVFPPQIEGKLKNLEDLLIIDCDSLTELFDMSSMVATRLRKLCIRRLPNLRSVFPSSIAGEHLRLEELEVVDCSSLEFVAMREGRDGVPLFRFPRLTRLELFNLPSLKGFCSGRHTSEWPMLKYLIMNFKQMAIFNWESQSSKDEADGPVRQHFFTAKQVIPNLEELTLNSQDVAMISHSQVSADLFCRVKMLRLQDFDYESTEFPVDLLQRYFYNLESLYVGRSSFDVASSQDGFMGGGNQGMPLARMRSLTLVLIYNLKHFWKQNSQLSCLIEKVEDLEVWQCDDLTSLAPLSASFKSLTTLDVYRCNGLLSLFTPSMAQCLLQLTWMRIRQCNKVTEAVATEGDGTEDCIVFSDLDCLILDCLPSLTTFCSKNHRFKFPSLETVIVKQCPKMRRFTVGVLSTPKLQKVQLAEGTDENCWTGDLNATIRHLFTETGQAAEKSGLPSSHMDPSSDSKATQAEEDTPLAEEPVSDALTVPKLSAISDSELELEVTTGEQEARTDITHAAPRCQDSDASSQDDKGGVVAESKSFCFPGLPKLDFDTAQEKNETFALSKEDPHVVENLSTNKDLPLEIESSAKITSQEQKCKNEMVEPGITLLASENKETLDTFKNEQCPGKRNDCSGAVTEDASMARNNKASTQTESTATSMLDKKEPRPIDMGFGSAPVASRPPSEEAGVELLENKLKVPVARESAASDQRTTVLLADAESSSTNEPYVQAVGLQDPIEAEREIKPTSLVYQSFDQVSVENFQTPEPARGDAVTVHAFTGTSSSTNELKVQAEGIGRALSLKPADERTILPPQLLTPRETIVRPKTLAPHATSFQNMAGQTLSAESSSGIQLSSRNLLAELSSITGIRRPPMKSDTTSRHELTPVFENLQQQRKLLSNYLSMSLEDVQQADAFDDIKRISLTLIQHSSSLQEKEDLKDFLSRLTEFKRQVKDSTQMMNTAETSRSSHSMKSMDLEASLFRGQDELTTLEAKFSEISEEAAALEMGIRRLTAKKDTLLGVRNSIASMLEKSGEEVSKVVEEWKSLQDESREVDKNWHKGKEMLTQANASWSLLKQSLRL